MRASNRPPFATARRAARRNHWVNQARRFHLGRTFAYQASNLLIYCLPTARRCLRLVPNIPVFTNAFSVKASPLVVAYIAARFTTSRYLRWTTESTALASL